MLGRRIAVAALLLGVLSLGAGAAAAPGSTGASATERSERGRLWSVAESPERVVIITDSALAGIRWTGSLARLTNAEWEDHLESCRRLVRSSCRGREGYRPLTAYEELQRIARVRGPAHADDVLVIAVGYNDVHTTFASDFELVMGRARAAGFRHIAWLTYRENVDYELPYDIDADRSNYGVMNDVLRAAVESGRWPELSLFDYDTVTRGITGWFASDGIHLTVAGGRGVADWLSAEIRFVRHPEFAPDNWVAPA